MTIPIRLLLKELGFRSLTHYAIYQAALRSGVLKARTRSYGWMDRPLADWISKSIPSLEPVFFPHGPAFTDRLADLQQAADRSASQDADEILSGSFRLFGGPPVSLGFPPDWLHALNGSLSAGRHWSAYSTEGDIDFRALWELSRFGWGFVLARAYYATHERRYADGFFRLLESWCEANPPNTGPNWVSAQEVALRIMALTFACYTLEPWLVEHPGRRDDLVAVIAAHADRIPPTLRYARAQRNNHLVTEAVGLFTAGLMFPTLRKARLWKALGRKWLSFALADQVFEDGGYIQHSTNYHRVALSAGLWAARLAELNAEPLSPETLRLLGRMTSSLIAVVDAESGRVPNFGNNDGSNILPLSSAAHADYRPVLQAASMAFHGHRVYSAGPWDETALWLGLLARPRPSGPRQAISLEGRGAEGRQDEDAAEQLEFPQTGLYLTKGMNTWAALRCAKFKSRPSHSDQLHVDLWWAGHNIARDRGSFTYTDGDLSAAASHNTLTADDQEPMRKTGRFLWLGWSDAQYLGRWRSGDGAIEVVAADHALPGRLLHRRSLVRVAETIWVVIDELTGKGSHEARLAWTLPDWPWALQGKQLSLEGEPGRLRLSIEPRPARLALYRHGEHVAGEEFDEDPNTLGYWCPTYRTREPALTLVAKLRGELPLRIASWWRLGALDPELAWDSLEQGPLSLFFAEEAAHS
jgi:hypothetical protein